MQEIITISTSKKQEMVDITQEVSSVLKKSKVKQGTCHIYVKHTTSAIIINENADPNICIDILEALNKVIEEGIWRHDKIDNNAASHIKASILGSSETIPIKNNELQLGAWQSPMFVELDGPKNNRKMIITIMGE